MLIRGSRRPMRPRRVEIPEDVRRYLLDLLAVEPCHITGEHDPRHTLRYVCNFQKRHAYDRTLRALGVDPENPPRKKHTRRCCWCHEMIGSREAIKEIKRWLKEGIGEVE